MARLTTGGGGGDSTLSSGPTAPARPVSHLLCDGCAPTADGGGEDPLWPVGAWGRGAVEDLLPRENCVTVCSPPHRETVPSFGEGRTRAESRVLPWPLRANPRGLDGHHSESAPQSPHPSPPSADPWFPDPSVPYRSPRWPMWTASSSSSPSPPRPGPRLAPPLNAFPLHHQPPNPQPHAELVLWPRVPQPGGGGGGSSPATSSRPASNPPPPPPGLPSPHQPPCDEGITRVPYWGGGREGHPAAFPEPAAFRGQRMARADGRGPWHGPSRRSS